MTPVFFHPTDYRGVGSIMSTFSAAEDETSTLAPVGSDKEVEYFFASDARLGIVILFWFSCFIYLCSCLLSAHMIYYIF